MDELISWNKLDGPDYWYGTMIRQDDRRFWHTYWVCWARDYKSHRGESFKAVTDDYGVLVPC